MFSHRMINDELYFPAFTNIHKWRISVIAECCLSCSLDVLNIIRKNLL